MRRLRCQHCGLPPTPAGHDPCIADLPGVDYACCGHGGGPAIRFDDVGDLDHCYIAFADGLVVYGNVARWAMRMLGGDPPDAAPDADPFPRERLTWFWD